jgi:hypothetical protein
VLSGNDFTLDINNPKHPKIFCVGNNPEKQLIYGAVLSLHISRLLRQANNKRMLKCSLVFDEFPTIYFNNMDSLIATARGWIASWLNLRKIIITKNRSSRKNLLTFFVNGKRN